MSNRYRRLTVMNMIAGANAGLENTHPKGVPRLFSTRLGADSVRFFRLFIRLL